MDKGPESWIHCSNRAATLGRVDHSQVLARVEINRLIEGSSTSKLTSYLSSFYPRNLQGHGAMAWNVFIAVSVFAALVDRIVPFLGISIWEDEDRNFKRVHHSGRPLDALSIVFSMLTSLTSPLLPFPALYDVSSTIWPDPSSCSNMECSSSSTTQSEWGGSDWIASHTSLREAIYLPVLIVMMVSALLSPSSRAQIYGGIGMAAMAICVLSIIALSNNSYMFARLVFYVWPLILIVVAVRAGFMSESFSERWMG